MDNNEGYEVLSLLGVIILVAMACGTVLSFVGYIMNILYIATTSSLGEGALRLLGVFIPPIGAVLGWFL